MFVWEHSGGSSAGGRHRRWGFTRADAEEGVSQGDFARFNLGDHVGDELDHVRSNRARLATALQIPNERLIFLQQVHGSDVHVVSGPWPGQPPAGDAMVTATAGLALVVLVADCTPVLLHAPGEGIIGVAHAGRPGLVAGVVPAAIAAMRELGASQIEAAVGPSVCGRCYEVPPAMYDDVVRLVPAAAARSWTGTHALDVATGVVDQLVRDDVSVTWVPGCTRESAGLFSYRRSPRTGRTAGVVMLRQ